MIFFTIITILGDGGSEERCTIHLIIIIIIMIMIMIMMMKTIGIIIFMIITI